MSTLRTNIIHATNTRALPAIRYRLQHHNSLPQPTKKREGIQPVAYVSVTKKTLVNKVSPKVKEKPKRKKEQTMTSHKKTDLRTGAVWKKGHGAIERLDKKTGEVFHLVQQTIATAEKSVNNKDNKNNIKKGTVTKASEYQLVRTRKPLKIGEKRPSPIIPQEIVDTKPLLIKKPLLVSFNEKVSFVTTLQKKMAEMKFHDNTIRDTLEKNTKIVFSAIQQKVSLNTDKLGNKTTASV